MKINRKQIRQLLNEITLGSFGDPTNYLARIIAKQAHNKPGTINGFIAQNILRYNFSNKDEQPHYYKGLRDAQPEVKELVAELAKVQSALEAIGPKFESILNTIIDGATASKKELEFSRMSPKQKERYLRRKAYDEQNK